MPGEGLSLHGWSSTDRSCASQQDAQICNTARVGGNIFSLQQIAHGSRTCCSSRLTSRVEQIKKNQSKNQSAIRIIQMALLIMDFHRRTIDAGASDHDLNIFESPSNKQLLYTWKTSQQ